MTSDENPWRAGERQRSDWRLTAACRDLDPELFFPVGNGRPLGNQVAEAKRVCLSCPVRTACLEWALRHYQDQGIWGGLTETERHSLRSPQRRSA